MKHKFVENIPEDLDSEVVYISIKYSTVAHKCCCGCGSEVITPLSPTDWRLSFDGETISVYPSIGSWNLPCKSHYWIVDNKIVWSKKWKEEEITQGRSNDKFSKNNYYKKKELKRSKKKDKKSFFHRFKDRWF